MTLFEAIVPVLIADGVILLSFFDDRIIRPKILQEISQSVTLTAEQKESFVDICSGASTLLMYLANILILISTSVLALEVVPEANLRFVLVAMTIIFLITIYAAFHIVARIKLSDIDQLQKFGPLTASWLLRIILIILNTLVIGLFAISLPSASEHKTAPSPEVHHT